MVNSELEWNILLCLVCALGQFTKYQRGKPCPESYRADCVVFTFGPYVLRLPDFKQTTFQFLSPWRGLNIRTEYLLKFHRCITVRQIGDVFLLLRSSVTGYATSGETKRVHMGQVQKIARSTEQTSRWRRYSTNAFSFGAARE